MTMPRFFILLSFAVLLGLQGCTVYTTTSPKYRVLTPPVLASVVPGMSKPEVLLHLGEPWREVTYALKPTETYVNWRCRDEWNRFMIFSAVFDQKWQVIRTETWPDPEQAKGRSVLSRR